ncbi:hypothetical protein H0H81_000990 [Sphagnurus paluster]|uniref:Alcohol dehydrogenase-like C-terminal domain-containing protein n=1 Tax=Sphagnurus paluster TaxID=117069 RepID=A0A9P7KIS3_9AGAR|nr:hypothetical protein H0H81_000990 [Sphagnurus paluster]
MGPTPVKAGDYFLILGTGGVSIFGLKFAVASGGTVVATSSSDEKLKVATNLGAKHVINYKTTPNHWDEEVLRITKGKGFQDMMRLLAANPDKTRPVVNKVFKFEEAKEAYSHLASQAHIGKVVIKVAKD